MKRLSQQDNGAWIEDPFQHQIAILRACQRGNAEVLQPLLECFDEHPHLGDFVFQDMLYIAVQAGNTSIICFLLKLAKRDGFEIDPSLYKAAFDADIHILNHIQR